MYFSIFKARFCMFINTRKMMGSNPSGERLQRISRSPNYRDGAFQNIEPTSVIIKDASYFQILKKHAQKPVTVKPAKAIPHVTTDLKNIFFEKPTIFWFGHSSYLIHYKGFNILVDPVFSGNASPVKFFGRSFNGADAYQPHDFPEIDLLLITHDHYDHLDYFTVTKLDKKIKTIVTSLGVGSHMEYWGVDGNKINELDWWESYIVNDKIKFTATPARHFSGRGISRGKTLWSSFVLEMDEYKIFIGGDSGYDKQFKIIGDKFKNFDLAFLECGQYGEDWPYIHMHPDETIKAAKDLNAKMILPVHWGKFVLANHPWNEPIEKLNAISEKENLDVIAPLIGQPFTIGEKFDQTKWWLQ